MRSSLSCSLCRKAKVKCVNTGTAPCEKCRKSGIATCVLTRPRYRPVHKIVRSTEKPNTAHNGPSSLRDATWQGSDGSAVPDPKQCCDKTDTLQHIDRHLVGLSTSVILKSLNVFTNKFPELGILHLPSFMKELQSADAEPTRMLLGAILVVTKSQLTLLNQSWACSLLDREHYAFYTREMLSQSMLQAPRIQTVQSLLVMALYEWGCCGFHQAWVYCGVAIRIMQAIHSQRVAPYPLEPVIEKDKDVVSWSIENRTFWTCFIMDRMVSSGTYNPLMLPMSEMVKLRVLRPLSTVEFAFGTDLAAVSVGFEHGRHLNGLLDITQSFEILVSGFDIWAQVMTFIFNDGRRAPGMCAAENCPWVRGSAWSRTRHQLEGWRADQHHRLHYPGNSVAVHMTLGYGESFTYINLLYYVSTLMLHREYFPFIPDAESKPHGPVDPTLEAEAPPGWWEDSALELFGAAENIAGLLHEASECGVHLATPFVGFCAFSASYMNLYVYRFPQMNLGRSSRAEALMNMCLAYLEEFRSVWKLGDAWLKTLHYASILYERASADRGRYRGKSRADFNTLHQSIHEFRVVDRSDEHLREIQVAESGNAASEAMDSETDPLCLSAPLSGLVNDLTQSAYEQGAWSQWWPALGEFNNILDHNIMPPAAKQKEQGGLNDLHFPTSADVTSGTYRTGSNDKEQPKD
ncbi:hypothetical protein BDV25DRAFT_135982 [Aspergillus avenaceus]|uniref:Zn(2)-C6 fungal-type domain-containing protein n=1 Tax=Aspergillus avenaceus TaxID=36643 RepID=A0A5N6U6X4_ASPAV|nr:hypothetical protein BDV25DRAFT_135982 [Aspergillus avenaceus]